MIGRPNPAILRQPPWGAHGDVEALLAVFTGGSDQKTDGRRAVCRVVWRWGTGAGVLDRRRPDLSPHQLSMSRSEGYLERGVIAAQG
jgi:hypothetical protein